MSWIKAIEDSLRETEDVVPKEWKTCKQISKEIDKSLSHTIHIVSKLVNAGKAEKRCFMIKTESRTMPVPHFKIKQASTHHKPRKG